MYVLVPISTCMSQLMEKLRISDQVFTNEISTLIVNLTVASSILCWFHFDASDSGLAESQLALSCFFHSNNRCLILAGSHLIPLSAFHQLKPSSVCDISSVHKNSFYNFLYRTTFSRHRTPALLYPKIFPPHSFSILLYSLLLCFLLLFRVLLDENEREKKTDKNTSTRIKLFFSSNLIGKLFSNHLNHWNKLNFPAKKFLESSSSFFLRRFFFANQNQTFLMDIRFPKRSNFLAKWSV